MTTVWIGREKKEKKNEEDESVDFIIAKDSYKLDCEIKIDRVY